MKDSIEFKDECGFMSVWYENDRLMGSLRKDDDGFYRFHPNRGAVMIQKHLRVVGDKMSGLNVELIG